MSQKTLVAMVLSVLGITAVVCHKVARQSCLRDALVRVVLLAAENSAARGASMRIQRVVVLSEQERAHLHTLIGQRSAPARALTHARTCSKPTRARRAPGGPTG